MNSAALIEFKKALSLTDFQRHLLTGMMLGDGHLERQGASATARLKIEHSVSQSAYLHWKYQHFESWVRSPPAVVRKANRAGTFSLNVRFTSLSHWQLGEIRDQFYDSGSKRIPENLVLTPISTAVWFMDDGSKKSNQCRGLYLNTQSFSPAEVDLLRWHLEMDINVETTVRKQSDGLQIYIPAKAVADFSYVIEPHVISSMRYKLPD